MMSISSRSRMGGPDRRHLSTPLEHAVEFYERDEELQDVVAEFLEAGFAAGDPVVVIAREANRNAFCARLGEAGIEVHAATASGALTLLDAGDMLARFMSAGAPDWERFRTSVGGIVEEVRARRPGHVRLYGEMVDLLWRDGRRCAAIQLEEFWNDLANLHPFCLLCAYSMGSFYGERDTRQFEAVCRAHSHIRAGAGRSDEDHLPEEPTDLTMLQRSARRMQQELEQRRGLEQALRGALAERRTVEQALRAREQELADFFENAAEGIHCVDREGVIGWVNRAELDLLGYPRDEYVGRNIAEFHVEPGTAADMLARLTRNETLKDYEARLRCKDGAIKDVIVSSNALFRDGAFAYTRCFTRDVTERKRLEEDLRTQNDRLASAVRLSELFVGILGHDLRNPLSAITMAAGLLAKEVQAEASRRRVARVASSARRIHRMIDQLLDVTRIRLGQGVRLDRRRADLSEICKHAIGEIQEAAPGREIRFRSRGDVVGSWDGDRLLQIVSNLLSNALAHGAGSGPIEVGVDGTDALRVAVEVRNDGAIPPEVLPVLFDPFRSGGKKKHDGSVGLGLGLFIGQQIAAEHDGVLEVASSQEEGTRFVLRLPRMVPVIGSPQGGRAGSS